jgi:periplasmic copper chaperone A
MQPDHSRRVLLLSSLFLGLGVVAAPARACEYSNGLLRVTHPWTRATAVGAHEAVLCMTIDEIAQDDRLMAVHTPVASGAVMAGADAGLDLDLPLRSGQVLQLHEAGRHIRLTGLQQPLEMGRSYPLQLVFERSGAIKATLNVDYTRFN